MTKGWSTISSPYVRVTVEYCWDHKGRTEAGARMVCHLSVRWKFGDALRALGKLYGFKVTNTEVTGLQSRAEACYRQAARDPDGRLAQKLRTSMRSKAPRSLGQAASVVSPFGPEAVPETHPDGSRVVRRRRSKSVLPPAEPGVPEGDLPTG